MPMTEVAKGAFRRRVQATPRSEHLMLRQGDSQVFKRYSQAKLNMMREALSRLDRQANEQVLISGTVSPN